MIICQKPCTLHDVDLVGAAGLVALGFVAWWFVLVPWQQTWSRYRGLAAEHAAAEAQLHRDLTELEQFQHRLAEVEGTAASQAEKVPRAASVSRLLRKMTDIAKEAQLELLNVAPQPTTRDGDYLASDIQVAGRGRSHDFIRFLDRFAQENPYQSLQYCSISRPVSSAQPTCDISWSVRLYLFPPDPQEPTGDRP